MLVATGSRKQRLKNILPVRISGTDDLGQRFTEVVHTLDVSHRGVRIAGVSSPLSAGDVITVQYRHRQAKYEVAWVDASDPRSKQVGLRSIDKDKDVWHLKLSPEEIEDDSDRPAEVDKPLDTRSRQRFSIGGVADYVIVGTHAGGRALIRDVSLGGCFVATQSPLVLEAQLEMLLQLGDARVNVFGVVRTARPPVGVGVEFTRFRTPDDKQVLEAKLAELASRSAQLVTR